MKFEVLILGTGSATPAYGRHPSAQIVNFNEELFLVDCGEGTQMQLSRFGIRSGRINHVFISHLHGDHYFGLPGLLSSMHLNGRKNDLHVYGHPGLKEVLDLQFKYSETQLKYNLVFRPTSPDNPETILQMPRMRVLSFPLHHRVPCTGFRFDETLRASKHPATRSYAYCSDTRAFSGYMDAIRNVDLLYHESTFLHEMVGRAAETLHSTALEAAQVADRAGAKKLLLGHYSARYKDPEPLLREARTVFRESELAVEGKAFGVMDVFFNGQLTVDN